MKKDTAKISRYNLTDGFFCHVVETEDMFDSWIGLDGYGIMDYMFGCPKKQTNGTTILRKDFIALVDVNADDYIAVFLDEYRDDLEVSHADLFEKYGDEVE